MEPEKRSIKSIKSNENTTPLHKDGWAIVTDINRHSGFITPIKNKSLLEAIAQLNDKRDAPYLIRFFFSYKEKPKKQSKAKL